MTHTACVLPRATFTLCPLVAVDPVISDARQTPVLCPGANCRGCPSIVFLPIDCLNSLANVARCPENRLDLLKTNVLTCYEAMLCKWLDQRNGCEPANVGRRHSSYEPDPQASTAIASVVAALQGDQARGKSCSRIDTRSKHPKRHQDPGRHV